MSEPITAELLTAFRSAQPAFSNVTTWSDNVVTEAFMPTVTEGF